MQSMSADQWTSFANVIWGIWRCRNDFCVSGAATDNSAIPKEGFWELSNFCKINHRTSSCAILMHLGSAPGKRVWVFNSDPEMSCWYIRFRAPLLDAIRYAIENGYSPCTFCTDNSTLATVSTWFQPHQKLIGEQQKKFWKFGNC